MDIIDTINYHRSAQGMSITEIAFQCDVSRQHMSLVLNGGIKKPSYDLISKAVRALGYELILTVPVKEEK